MRWQHIQSIEAAPSPIRFFCMVRLAGVSPLFGSYGYFKIRGIGACWLYVTRQDRLVVLRRREGVPIVLSPDHPDGFIDAVRDRLPGDRPQAA